MIGDAARRYWFVTGTASGRRSIACGLLGIAAVVVLCAPFVTSQPVRGTLLAAAAGMLGVACIFLVARKAK